MPDVATTPALLAVSSGDNVEAEGSRLGWPDALVIVAYFAFVLFVGLWSSRRGKKASISSYFLASRNMHWIPVGASLFASNIGSGHFIGLAGSGAASGLAVGGYEQLAVYIIMLLGWLFVPVYMSSGIYTMPEYMRERFGGQRIRIYLSFLALILYIFTKISADLYAGALFIQLALNKNSPEWLYLSILFLLIIAALFTIAGGLTAVVWTDFVQTIVMIVGAFILMVLTFSKVGGFQRIVEDFPYAVASVRAVDASNNSCGGLPSNYMSLFRSIKPGVSDYPWTGMTFGLTVSSIWYWCADQVIVQRTLASKNLTHARGGCILASYLKFLPMFLLVIPGMASRILFPDRVGCASPETCEAICGSPGGCTNIAYVELVLNLLPTGMAGLMLAVMMAALMSSLTSIFNSASTIFTIDVWMWGRKRFSKTNKPSDTELVIVGRLFVLILVIFSVLWIPVIQHGGNSELFDYIQSVSSFLASPISAVYLLAMFWERTNEPGAFWGLMAGLFVGMLRFIIQFSYVIPPCGSGLPDPRPEFVKVVVGNVHFLHFRLILFLITIAVSISVTLMTPPIPSECLYRLTYWSRHDTRVRRPLESKSRGKRSTDISENPAGDSQEMALEQEQEELPHRRRILSTLCGVKASTEDNTGEEAAPKLTPEQEAEEAAKILDEKPFWSTFVNINAIICITLSTFMYGMFA